ncbi:MAG: SMC-Scp complex subunit ScpB [Spirochaetales bacterium]|nr:SMC-Scp complex subunit ScpB [Spirochaetales bacterium]
MTNDGSAAIIEAVLFLDTEPLDIKAISLITGLAAEDVTSGIEMLKNKYAAEGSGLEILQQGEGYILSPKEQLWDLLKDRYGKRNENRLSRAAIETLSIIAYSQPITKAEIENIRGVSADGMMRVLTERKLVRAVGKKDIPGKPVQFGTTREFLKYFKIASIAELPKLDELNREKFGLDDE